MWKVTGKTMKVKQEEQEYRLLSEKKGQKEFISVPFGYKLTLKDGEIKQIVKDCKQEIEVIKNKRRELLLEEDWSDWRDLYNGVTTFRDYPWPEASNFHIHVTAMTVDIGKTKTKQQMFISPMMILKSMPTDNTTDIITNVKIKENFMNYKVLEELEAETNLDAVLSDAWLLGAGIAKLKYLRLKEQVRKTGYYTYLELEKFQTDFENSKDTKEYKRNLKLLEKGESVRVVYDTEEIIIDNPVIEHVQLENLYVRPDIPDLSKQRVIGEKSILTWLEVLDLVDEGYIEKSVTDELKKRHEKDYYKRDYTLWECRTFWKYDDTKKKKRIIITYFEDEDLPAKVITYPFEHNQPDYIFYYIKKKAGSIYGEGIGKRLNPSNRALNALWNQTIDSGSLRNAPVFQAPRDSFDPTAKKYGPATIWWTKAGAEIKPVYTGGHPAEIVQLISKMERYIEIHTGISQYASGQESPTDPRAPASKAYMLLKESNLRINDCIKQLHKSNKKLFELVDSLLWQYSIQDEMGYYFKKDGQEVSEKMSRSILGIKVQYIPQLSDITISKEVEKEENIKFATFLMGHPLIGTNPKAQREILEILIRNQGDVWEKNINNLIPSQEMLEQALAQTQGGQGGGMQPPAGGPTPYPMPAGKGMGPTTPGMMGGEDMGVL